MNIRYQKYIYNSLIIFIKQESLWNLLTITIMTVAICLWEGTHLWVGKSKKGHSNPAQSNRFQSSVAYSIGTSGNKQHNSCFLSWFFSAKNIVQWTSVSTGRKNQLVSVYHWAFLLKICLIIWILLHELWWICVIFCPDEVLRRHNPSPDFLDLYAMVKYSKLGLESTQ